MERAATRRMAALKAAMETVCYEKDSYGEGIDLDSGNRKVVTKKMAMGKLTIKRRQLIQIKKNRCYTCITLWVQQTCAKHGEIRDDNKFTSSKCY